MEADNGSVRVVRNKLETVKEDYLKNKICILYAGMAAENILLKYNIRRKRHEKRNIYHFVMGSLRSTCH